MEDPMRYLRFFLFPLMLLALGGCANLNDTQQRALTGGAIGATGGAIIGTAIGGAVGATAGVIVPQLGHDAARLVGANGHAGQPCERRRVRAKHEGGTRL
jgi:osmotically inducible lipoprotein OsmB